MNTEGLLFTCSCCVLTAVHFKHKPCGDPDHACTLTGDFEVVEVFESIDGREPLFTCDGCNTTAEMTMYVLREV